jgi:DNA-binding NarL/FixJ family response regulator
MTTVQGNEPPLAERSDIDSGSPSAGAIRVGLIGGKRIFRRALAALLEDQGLAVSDAVQGEEDLCESLGDHRAACDVIVLIVSGGPFTAFHRIHETLKKAGDRCRLVVLSEHATRGQIYAALRIGAKAYVNLDAEPDELKKAILMAEQRKVHLAPDAAELLVRDISAGGDPAGRPTIPSVELSRREVEVVQLLCEGLSSKEVAKQLHISSKTVENHRYNIYRKCEVDGIAGLMRHAIQNGLVSV